MLTVTASSSSSSLSSSSSSSSPSSPPSSLSSAATRKIFKRTGFTRQRRGCLTCRQRKKKCDQSLPICGGCSRLNLVCKRETPRELPQKEPGSASSSTWGNAHVVEASSWACRHHTHRPSFSHARESASEVMRLAKIYEPLDIVPADPLAGNDLVASRRTMTRYYTTTLAVMLTAVGENTASNCFLSVLLPMAFDCPALLDTITAMSSAHLALQYPSIQDTALQHRGRALSSLTASLKNGTLTSEMFLAVAMAMCSMDTISVATSSSWSHHLAGAAAALQSLKSSNLQLISSPRKAPDSRHSDDRWLRSFEGKWLLRNFAYHDILMSVSLDRRPFIPGDYWISADDGTADTYFGFASKTMQSISDISVLNADCTEQSARVATAPNQPGTDAILSSLEYSTEYSTATAELDMLLQRAHAIATSLRQWELPASVSADAPVAILSGTFRCAALIYLHRVVRRHFPQHRVADVIPEGVQPYVAAICDAAQKIPEGSLTECSLIFPLFMAGGEAENQNHIDCIRSRLCTMNKWRRFRNVDACREVLEQVWRLGEEYRQGLRPNRVDWRQVLEEKGWRLALS